MGRERTKAILDRLGVGAAAAGGGQLLESVNPATGQVQGGIRAVTRRDYDGRVAAALRRFEEWRMRPPPKRGEVVRHLGELLREHRDALGELVSLESGKIRTEGVGEVQEMIDICDFAVGLSRQLHGVTIASERRSARTTPSPKGSPAPSSPTACDRPNGFSRRPARIAASPT
jgi:aldehyde dehydrogenase (NAD+)